MIAVAKVDIINKYANARKVEVPLDDDERREAKRSGSARTTKMVVLPVYYAKSGDELTIITEWIGEHTPVVACMNKVGERFSARLSDLQIQDNG